MSTQPPPAPRRIILEQPMGEMRKLFLSLALVALGISLMFNLTLFGAYHSYFQTEPGIEEKFKSGSQTATDKIAVIKLKGLITEGDGFVKKQIDRIAKDENVKAIVLRVESPGGTVAGSDYIYHHLQKLRIDRKIPLVVSMGGLAASGGYYVSMAADGERTIYAEPATWTGSIGVIIPHYDISNLLKKYDVKDDSIASGPLKEMLSPTRDLSDDPKLRTREREAARELVNESFDRFKELVAAGRPKLKNDPELMTKATTGQIFSAKQALQLGLIDEIGYLDDAIARAAEIAKLDLKDVRVVEYRQPKNLLSEALGGSSSESTSHLSMVLDMTAPRAYYLCTWLPAVLGTQQ